MTSTRDASIGRLGPNSVSDLAEEWPQRSTPAHSSRRHGRKFEPDIVYKLQKRLTNHDKRTSSTQLIMYRAVLASSSRAAVFSARQLPASRAPFHTSPVSAKTVTEKVKEVASDVNIKVGRTLASGIEKGQQAAETTKQAVGGSSVSEVADNVSGGNSPGSSPC